MRPSGDWDLKMIRLHLPHYEEVIRKLNPSSFGAKDTLVWLPEKSGVYSSKSGYAIAKVYNSSTDEDFNWRKCIWNVKCSPKIKHFLWKMKMMQLQ